MVIVGILRGRTLFQMSECSFNDIFIVRQLLQVLVISEAHCGSVIVLFAQRNIHHL